MKPTPTGSENRMVSFSGASDTAVGGTQQTVCSLWSCSEVTGIPGGGGPTPEVAVGSWEAGHSGFASLAAALLAPRLRWVCDFRWEGST